MKLERDKFEKMKDEYYAIRGWDVKTGIPTEETLKKFDLEDVAKDLKNGGYCPLMPKLKLSKEFARRHWNNIEGYRQ